MKLWIDAQLSPVLAVWIRDEFRIEASAVRDLGLRDAEDEEIFQRAKMEMAVIMSKDSDFLILLERHGPPPQVIWITCGNTSNAHFKNVLRGTLAEAIKLLEMGEPLIEIAA